MATIDKLDFRVHVQYARRTQMVESINKEYRISEASSIPEQIKVVDMYPRFMEIDLLLGMVRSHAPWAMFWPPRKFFSQRRPSFTSYRVLPSLGTLEKQVSDYSKINNYSCRSSKQESEKQAIMSCFQQIDKINGWIGHIIGRVAQFLQG